MATLNLFLLVLFVFILVDVVSAVVINEIMYDPAGSDEGHEWIEIYSNESINVSGWKFYENGVNHGLTLVNGTWIIQDYAIIADDSGGFMEDYPLFAGTLFDSSWGSLSNSGEIIGLRNSSLDIVEEVDYSDRWGGKYVSLERIDPAGPDAAENWGDSFANATPGAQNSLYGSCDWSTSLVLDQTIWEMDNDSAVVKWKVKVEENNDDGEVDFSYWIEDAFGKIVKSKVDKNSNVSQTFGYYQKTYHDPGGYIMFANITNISCTDFNFQNNIAQSAIIIIGEGRQGASSGDSSISILDVSPASVEFGSIIKVKLQIYRGDTGKYAVYAYVEGDGKTVSEKSTIHVKSKNTDYTMTIPVQLKANCNGKYDNGDYEVIVEGLDVFDSKKIEVEGTSLCKTTISSKSTSSQSPSKKKFEYKILDKPAEVESDKPFTLTIELKNADNQDYPVDVWSYVYRGSKSYSGGRESNKKSVILYSGHSEKIVLENKVDAGPGDYKLKVKIKKAHQKTTHDLTESLVVKKIPTANVSSSETFNQSEGSKLVSWSEAIIYESTSFKSKKLVPFLFVGVLSLLSLLLLFKI